MNNPADEIIKNINPPDYPGVYIMRDQRQQIIYIGKAASLKKRLNSYRRPLNKLDAKTNAMVTKIDTVEMMLTDSEIEALMLEYNLIKKHRPKYNVVMRDDKSYPYLKITKDDYFPRLVVTRNPYIDQAKYYGPYIGLPLKQVARDLSFAFNLCVKKILKKRLSNPKRSCLYYQMNRCSGVCMNKISEPEYMKLVQGLEDFLEGKQDKLTPIIKKKMAVAAGNREYEQAAQYRDQLDNLARVRNLPSVISSDLENKDIIAIAKMGNNAAVEIFNVRQGALEGRRHFFLQHVGISTETELYSQLLTQYYAQPVMIPSAIIIEKEPSDKPLLLQWLSSKKQADVAIRLPENHEEKRLLKMAETNAWLYLKHQNEEISEELSDDAGQKLADVQRRLNLSQLPVRIECYDISNISGQDAVGSQVVFTNGLPDKRQYRKYKIKTIPGPNDFAMMQEVLFRRFKKLKEEASNVPDLVVVDGGAGQLSAGLKVLDELELKHIPMIALAKKQEEIYLPNQSSPLQLSTQTLTIRLLTGLRDEAHRFAISYHRKLRSKRLHTSLLDNVAGLGPVIKSRLLRQFGSVEAIIDVPVEEMTKIAGIDPELARDIQRILKKKYVI